MEEGSRGRGDVTCRITPITIIMIIIIIVIMIMIIVIIMTV